jgi:GntR family transcriptional regulator/MocR family aminotransferase
MRHVLAEAPTEAFDYAEWPGRFELRDAVAQYLRRARGVHATAEDVLACCGAGHGLGLIFRTLAQQGRQRIAVEDPCSQRLRHIAAEAGLRIVALPCDEQGARTDSLRRLRVDAVVVTPAHQFPLGVTMAPDRRTKLITWARETQAVVIEDDYDGELRYDRQPVGALQPLDPERVVYVGTTSKSLAPALRLGWLVVPQRLHDPLVQTVQRVNAMPSSLEQLAFARLIVTAEFDRHIRRIRGMYRERRDLLIDTLARVAPRTRVAGVSAGGHAVVLLDPSGPGEAEIVAMAAADGIALAGLDEFYAGSREATTRWPGPGLVIGYATPAGRSHRAAIEALGQVLARADRS